MESTLSKVIRITASSTYPSFPNFALGHEAAAAGSSQCLEPFVHRKGHFRKHAKQKPFWINQKGFLMRSLTVTYFHRKYNRLSSAQKRFTVLFGMGRSGTTLLWPSGKGFVSLISA